MKKIAALILFYLIVMCCIVAFYKIYAAYSCSDIRYETEMPTKYSMTSGCYIQDKTGQWWPI